MTPDVLNGEVVPDLAASIRVSQLQNNDLPAVWAIEQTLTGPWTYGQLEEELAIAHGLQLVAKDLDGQVCAYLFASLVLDEAEIRKIAVAESQRRQGIAHLLLATACRSLHHQQAARCFLELRASNLPALSLYQKNGFQIVGRRKSYYTQPIEDAMILQKSFGLL